MADKPSARTLVNKFNAAEARAASTAFAALRDLPKDEQERVLAYLYERLSPPAEAV